MNDLSFYIHIPYCIKRCGYCDFNTYTPSELREGASLEVVSGDYIDAVLREIDLAAQSGPGSVPTIFFGGGTPSLLKPQDLGRVITAIKERWEVTANCEITLEANPDSVDAQTLREFREAGFNRVSFGMQSAVPHVLKVLDRTHQPENVARAVQGARDAGFESVSVDLIYGTPGESLDDWQLSVETALNLSVDHISAYALIVESGTKLASSIKRGEIFMPDDDLMADMYLLIDERAESAGMQWYELSNWAKPGHESRHNIAYWENANWWGAGPGAHSHIDGVRWSNIKHPNAYKSSLLEGKSIVLQKEILTQSQLQDEAIMLSIRMRKGIALERLTPAQIARIQGYCASGHLDKAQWDLGALQLTAEGRLIADRIVRELVV
ncbi:MAG: radical SAM family heme chaperone HemW [Actinobacteria bacterium]|nr:radical SAM family heme chaperone HemW [Actinomycetota bacterium]